MSGKRGAAVAVVLVVAVVLGALAARQLVRFPSTDDARVDADVVSVAAQVAGPVVHVAVRDNQAVRAGDLLFEIEPAPFRIEVEKARAQLDRTGQNLSGQVDSVASAEAEVRQAQASLRLAEVQFSRIDPLADIGAVSYQDRDRAQAQLDKARSSLADARARLSKARHELGEVGDDNPERRSAVAALERAELDLGYTRVLAPVNGYVTALGLRPGAYASPGAPLLSIVDDDSWRVVAHMRETQLRHILPGMRARVTLPAYPGVEFEGRVQGIGWGIQPTDGTATPGGLPTVSPTVDWVRLAQRFPVRITLVNRDTAHPLRKGMTASVSIDTTSSVEAPGGEGAGS